MVEILLNQISSAWPTLLYPNCIAIPKTSQNKAVAREFRTVCSIWTESSEYLVCWTEAGLWAEWNALYHVQYTTNFCQEQSTLPRLSEISEKNMSTRQSHFLHPFMIQSHMLKVWKKSWEPFRIYQLTSTTNLVMALYHKWDVKNGFAYVLTFFSL